MSETLISIEDAAAHLSELVERVHSGGEPAVIVKSGRPLVKIVPVFESGSTQPGDDDLAAFLRRWR